MVNYGGHALLRSVRLDVRSESKFENYVERAWKNGKKVSDFNGKAYEYLRGIETKKGNHVTLRIFAGYCFIFTKKGFLITEYKLSKWVLQPQSPKRTRFRGEGEVFASDYEVIMFIKMGQLMSFFLFQNMI